MEIGGDRKLVGLEDWIRKKHKIRTYTLVIDTQCYESSILDFMLAHSISLETLVINEILRSDDREDFTIRNLDTTQTWAYTRGPSSGSGGEGPNIIQELVAKIYATCRTLVYIFFMSNLTSLVLRTLFVTAPVFLFYPVQWFAGTRREAAFNKFCADYPWIGLYAYSLKNNGGRGVTTLLLSYIGFLVLVFTGYNKGVSVIVDWLFLGYYPRGLETRFKLSLVLFETLNQLFVRTRTSIEYFPVVYIAGLICFVHYVNSTAYGLYSICLCLAVSIILAFFFYLLLAVEIPAITTWDPNQGNTPSESKPRAMFFPLFSMEWIHDLPQFWTAFFPLWGRSQFTLSQLSLVDRDYEMLNASLDNAINQNLLNSENNNVMANANNNNNNNNNVNNVAENPPPQMNAQGMVLTILSGEQPHRLSLLTISSSEAVLLKWMRALSGRGRRRRLRKDFPRARLPCPGGETTWSLATIYSLASRKQGDELCSL
eukprot:TRINITY_DN2046_c0_g1_i9.p1 TRINITY_DN2046_c0_g1~~TRINITY_DN2046_c0_g1_i9.p1  ORF type:complete len:484 (-),score=94.26 TRINITY_DN2046_c0_g1_i9:264-1715(-)